MENASGQKYKKTQLVKTEPLREQIPLIKQKKTC